MKRVLAIALALLASCALIFGATFIRPSGGAEKGQYKLGMGTAVTIASGEGAGAKATVTTAAVITDGNGKIVDCIIDCGDFAISFDDVKAKKNGTYLTKHELGDDYGMVAYKASDKEWYEQAAYFANYVKGMNANDATLLALSADGKAGSADLAAGCTIAVSDFKVALVKAMGDTLAVSFKSDKTPVLSLAMINKDSFEDSEGTYPVAMTTDLCAMASYNGKVLAAVTDVCESKFAYDTEGVLVTGDFGGTKREKLDTYGMVAYAGAKAEWYSQAQHFCSYIQGMTAEEIAAIEMGDKGQGTDADLTAGCTIAVGGFMGITEKALKAASAE